MRKALLLIVSLIALTSCTQYKMVYDARKKTDQILKEELNSEDGPFILTIAFEKSLKNEHVKIEGRGIVNPADWITYFDGKLNDCGEYSCKTLKVNSSGPIFVYINKKKILLGNNPEHSLYQHRYLFISKENGSYILYFSNYPKTVW